MKTEIESKTPLDRLDYSGELDSIVDRISKAYGIGPIKDFSVIETGYEDCNVKIVSEEGDFVAKIFSKERKEEEILRYITIMEKVVEAGVNHPELSETTNGGILYIDREVNTISSVLMRFVEGQNFIELNRTPDDMELKLIIEQAAKINSIDYKPSYLFDSWAIPNIKIMFDKVKEYIPFDDLKMVEEVLTQQSEISEENLPHCFVHGDFTKANILKGVDGKIYILDFSVANWYPRIQELSVITANLLDDNQNSILLTERLDKVLSEYTKFYSLTKSEERNIYNYSLAAVAMEFLGAHQEKYINGNDTKETDFWMKLGRDSLRREFEAKG